MGQRESKKSQPPLPEDLLDMYIRSEFNAMDTDKDGKLSRKEVRRLLSLLGFKKSKYKLKALHVPGRNDTVSLEDYVSVFKADSVLVGNDGLWKKIEAFMTDRFRQMFKKFDKNSDGWATKQEVISGLEEAEIEVDEALRETVEKMDANDDGKVSYEEFLALEFQIALRRIEDEKKKSMFDED